ncbi:MAG: hypothetical protein K5778_05755 [Bacteroidaceae bacterium]|nr:hypothetical protein [Bacteroidaceae bacterium]
MRKNLLLSITMLLCMMMSALGAQAQSWTASAPDNGTFYIYNVGAEKFLASGTSWGSRASIEPHGAMALTLAANEGGYTISTAPLYTDKYLGADGYMDNGTAAVWTFVAVSGQADTYKMKNGSNYLFWDGTGTWTTSVGSDPGNANGYWKLVTKDNLLAVLPNGTLEDPVDATYLIVNNWFCKGNGSKAGMGYANIDCIPTGWSGEYVQDYWGVDTWDAAAACYCIEQYHRAYDNYQKFTNVPNGTYTLSAQGFYRADDYNGTMPYIYANSDRTTLKSLTSENPPAGTPNGIGAAATAFLQGYYNVSVTTKVTNGILRIGVKDESNSCWTAFDNFSLIYKGPDAEPISSVAVEFPGNGETLAANTWYYFDIPANGDYTFDSNGLGNFVYTTNGEQNIHSSSISTSSISSSMTLSAGRIYFLTTGNNTLTIGLPAELTVNGDTWSTGEYYIYNVGGKRYLTHGSAWGMHAIVDGAGESVVIGGTQNAATLHLSKVTSGYLGNDAYVDKATDAAEYTTWKFEPVNKVGYTNVFKLKANNGGSYLKWEGGGAYGWANEALMDAAADGQNSYWILVRKETRENYSAASSSNPVDMTWKVTDPDIEVSTDGSADAWSTSGSTNFVIQSNGATGTAARFLERWTPTSSEEVGTLDDCETEQNLIGLPEGHYQLSVTAHSEQQAMAGAQISGAYFFAGSNKVAISGVNTYTIDFIADVSGVKIGYSVEGTNANWVYFDNVRLKYYGPIAEPLPNDNVTELVVGKWYYYDASAVGPYTLEGPVTNIVYTQNGDNLLDANPVTKTAQSKLILDAGRVYFQATAAGTTLKITSVNAEGITNTFTAASLNVDGLPTINIDLFNVHVNPDGRGEQGAKDISKYLMMSNKRYDLLAVQEDFNYNSELVSEFGNTYGQGKWRGEVGLSSILNPPSDTDGLNFFWNKNNGREASGESWTRYNTSVATEGNQYIKKGFRYYEVTLADGLKVDVYITHMDAGDGDAVNSRNAQWTQLANAVIQNAFTTRPKIIMGDFNSRYTRENIIANFKNPIEETGNYEFHDVWVDLIRSGSYPSVGDPSLSNEVVDKMIYLNPTAPGSATLTPLSYSRETDYTVGTVYGTSDNTALGDHGPIVVQFRATKPAVQYPEVKDRWAWTGETFVAQATRYLYNVNFGRWDSGRNGFLTNDGTLVRDPNLSNVNLFHLYGDQSSCSVNNGIVKLRMDYIAGRATYVADLIPDSESGATEFEFQQADAENSEGVNLAYHLYKRINSRDYYFGADDPTTLQPHRNKSKLNAWALISSEQLQEYNRYCAAWDKGMTYVSYLPLEDETIDEMNELLQRTEVRWTDTTTEDLEALNAQIEAWFDDNQTAHIVNPSFEFDSNGNQLTTATTYTNYVVPGWTVPHDVDEAFISNKNVSGDGWTRNFNDVDGNYVFNTFGGTPSNGFYVRQTISGLPEGFYKLKAVTASYAGNSITLEIGNSTQTTPITVDRPLSQHLEVPLYYHNGEGSIVIGASSSNWFEIDDFQLYRYDYYYDETIGTSEYATTAIRYNTEIPAGVEVYYATKINEASGDTGDKIRNFVHLEKYEGKHIAAGEGVILYKGGNDAARQFRFYRTNEDVERIADNHLLGAVDRIEVADKQAGCTYYVLSKKTITYDKRVETVNETTGEVTTSTVETTEPVIGFYKLANTTAVPAHKAYIRVDAMNEFAVKGYIFSFDEDVTPTAVKQIETDAEATVTGIYSLNGARQQTLQRGMNIVRMSDGSVKKILVK